MKKLSSSPPSAEAAKRKSRSKTHRAWERVSIESNGKYKYAEHELILVFPLLTTMQVRVCVLVWDKKESWEIAEILHISEHTVENYRHKIRKKLRMEHDIKLHAFLYSHISAPNG